MKNNIIMNINKLQLMIIGILSLIIILPGQVKADDSYVPMIREDRVWEYKAFIPNYPGPTYYTCKFDGTITVNDKVYHAFSLINCKSFDWEYNDDYTHTESLISDTDLEGKGEKYFLREEDGKVYILVSEYYDEPQPYMTYEKLSDISFNSTDKLSERVLYDSTLSNGSLIYLNLDSSTFMNEQEIERMTDYSWYRDYILNQFYGNEIEIDNERCRMVGYFNADWVERTLEENPDEVFDPAAHPESVCWIEGIGFSDGGILSINSYFFPIGLPHEKTIDKSNQIYINIHFSILRSVYTTDGRVLYGEEPISGVERTEAETLTVGAADGAVTARGAGNIEMTVCGLDGVCVASASGDCEVTIPTTGIGRGLYIVTASDGARTRTLKLRL